MNPAEAEGGVWRAACGGRRAAGGGRGAGNTHCSVDCGTNGTVHISQRKTIIQGWICHRR